MARLSDKQLKKLALRHKQIQFYGTEENGYGDSGLFNFLSYVKTKDSHDNDRRVKPILGDGAVYLVIVALYMLACDVLLLAKSRQMRFSWFTTAFGLWDTMRKEYQHTIYQTKKEDDAFHMITFGAKNPMAGRADFILQHLPRWLRDDHVCSGSGNTAGKLTLSPRPSDPSGAKVPWYGSVIESVPQGADQVRGKTPSLYLSDESAYQDAFRACVVALRPAVTGGGKFIGVSTVDAGSAFNEMVLDVDHGENARHVIHPVVRRGMEFLGISWPKGMRSWKTRSGAWVLETHYTADPAKDPAREGADWFAEAIKGYTGGVESAGWQTEMEINYSAGGGEPVFPRVSVKSGVFVDHIDPQYAMNHMEIYAGYDYGTTNPSAYEVTGVDERKRVYGLWELKEPCVDLHDHCRKIRANPYWRATNFIIGDWSLANKTQRDENVLRGVIDQFADCGIVMNPGRRGAPVRVAQRLLGEYGWSDPDNLGALMAFVSRHDCPGLVREITQTLRWQSHVSEAVQRRKSNPERIMDKNDDCFAGFSYVVDTIPPPLLLPAEPRPVGTTMNDMIEESLHRSRMEKRRGEGIRVP